MREVAGDIIMNPTPRSLPGRVQGLEHGIGDAHSDSDVGGGESLQHKWVSIKEPYFGDLVGLQELHHLGRWERVRRHGAPVQADGSGRRTLVQYARKEKESTETRTHREFGEWVSLFCSHFQKKDLCSEARNGQ
ncbi:hypothetical protein SLEP1_g20999 [Rubroshorea leprosula]|uniref:Uncharacterized protein n=1 Tax=Rubroshorea leprosula TaxID=152421 RepID=A0AAV5JDB6_9ROSI|nr:hypothetical protein SLEP1_g20999 [Rubroshorea leprosula]